MFLRDDDSLQKLKASSSLSSTFSVNEGRALEFEVSRGNLGGFDIFFKGLTTTMDNNGKGDEDWFITRCVCIMEDTNEIFELKMEESATIAMLKVKLRSEMNDKHNNNNNNNNNRNSNSSLQTNKNRIDDYDKKNKTTTTTTSNILNGKKMISNNINNNQNTNSNNGGRIILNSSPSKPPSMKPSEFRGYEEEELGINQLGKIIRNTQQQQKQKQKQQEQPDNKKSDFLRDLSEFANELAQVVAPTPVPPKDVEIVTNVPVDGKAEKTKNKTKLESMESWEKVDEWQAWGEIGKVQVTYKSSPPTSVAVPNVNVNVKKVERGKMEPKKLNATKVITKKKQESSLFIGNFQNSFKTMVSTSTKYSAMIAELAPGFASHSLSAHVLIFITLAVIFVKILGFTFWLLLVVLVCYARVRSEEKLRALADGRSLELQSKLAKMRDELEKLQFASATVAANMAARGGSFSSGSASFLSAGQSDDVLWMNSTIAACWVGFLRNWLSSLARNVLSEKLMTHKPSLLESIVLEKFEMKHKNPTCGNVKVLRSRNTFEGVMLELGFEVSDVGFNMNIHAKLSQHLKIPLKLAVELDATNLLLRTTVLLIDRPPYAAYLRTSFADLPQMKIRIIPEGVSGRMGNIAELPGIDVWIKNSVQEALVANLLEPNSYTWNIEEFFESNYK